LTYGNTDRSSLKITANAAEGHRVHSTTHMWICSLLRGRNIIISLGENQEEAHNNKVSAWRCLVTSAVDPGC
jgi:hypothetical protein